MTYTARLEALTDALSEKDIDTAAGLAEAAGIAPRTAQAVMRGEEVTLATVNKIRRALGADRATALFEWVGSAVAK